MRCIRPRARRCPLLGDCDAAVFCSSVVEGLGHLERTLADGGGGSVSMRWCADAMRLVKKMQRELLSLFKKSGAPVAVSFGAGDDGGGGWFEHYMQETATLLDFCNTFKSAASRLHRYCMFVDFAVQTSGCTAAAVSVTADGWPEAPALHDRLSDVKAAVREAEQLGRKPMSTRGADGGGTVVAILVAKITMTVVSLFVLRALASPAPLDVGCCTVASTVPELKPWSETLSAIDGRFPRPGSVAEHQKLAVVVTDLANAIAVSQGGGAGAGDWEEEVARLMELLRTRSGELREGVEAFDGVLDEVFDEVMKGRSEMLGILRDKALTLE